MDNRQVPIPPQAINALELGKKIEAIKILRNASGLGLKESKDAVEAYLAANPDTREKFQANARSQSGCGAAAVFLIGVVTAGIVGAWLK